MAVSNYQLTAPLPASSPFDEYDFKQALNSEGYRAALAERGSAVGFRIVDDSGWGVVAWMEDDDEAREGNQRLSALDVPDGVTAEQILGCASRLSISSDDDADGTHARMFEEFVQFLMERFGLLLYDHRLGEWRCLDNRPGCTRILVDLEKGAGLTLDREEVPSELQVLVPYVEKWSFDSLDDQDAFVAQMQQHRPEEIAPFNRAVDDAHPLIRRWGEALPFRKHVSELTAEDRQHPYWSFLNVLTLRETTGYDEDDPEVIAARERLARELHVARYREATARADEAFRQGDYASYVSVFEPFDDLLTATQKKKLSLAMRRADG